MEDVYDQNYEDNQRKGQNIHSGIHVFIVILSCIRGTDGRLFLQSKKKKKK